MSERVIAPKSRGFLFLDSHPAGCRRSVEEMWRAVPAPAPAPVPAGGEGPVALVIGSSAGYGLAATIAGLARAGIRGIGVCFEKAPARRTGTAGWYRTAATARLARRHGRDMVFLDGDAFGDTVKEQVADLLAERFGGRLDFLVYSVAAPRRTDPDTGDVYASVLKPIGSPYTTKTLVFDEDGAPEVKEVTTAASSMTPWCPPICQLVELWDRLTGVRPLYGFSVPGVDHAAAVETDVPWPEPTA
ncbi:hypothetical protein AB0E83_24300 [Streptomyces sp. NPDC035033]|uniref:hypothetical protein n=1 Tax=Streptomyces sp. NPDC035033 TaxID=3155368 RepID=UPI0034066C26